MFISAQYSYHILVVGEQDTDPKSFLKLVRSEYKKLPIALPHVQSWSEYIRDAAAANCGSPETLQAAAEA